MHCCYEIDIIMHDIVIVAWEIKFLFTRRELELIQSSTTSRKNDSRKLFLSFTTVYGYYKRFDDGALYLLLVSSMR